MSEKGDGLKMCKVPVIRTVTRISSAAYGYGQ